jgi:hypothetical protein
MFDDRLPNTTRRIVLILFVVWVVVISCSIHSSSSSEPVSTSNAPTLSPDEPAPTSSVPTATPFQPILITSEPTLTANTPASTGSFELVGHTPLLQRGMNAGLAVHGTYAYVGSRTDGSHLDAGVLVVDISNPASPTVVYQIGPPEEGNVGQTSRELRVWPEQELLVVLNFNCEAGLHHCQGPQAPPNISVYDISGANASKPELIAVYILERTPHEFFLWDDPNVDSRALLYVSTPARFSDNLLVIDISRAREGVFAEVGSWGGPIGEFRETLHSLSLSPDGRRAYLAHLRDGFMILDTSDLAEGIPNPQMELLTPVENWVRSGPGAHSAVKLFGKPYALVTEEVYGRCPWGWTFLLDITDETKPAVVAEYRLVPYNTLEHCAETSPERYRFTSFSSHNPTLTKNMAFITWHSGGLQAVSIENPFQPIQLAEFLPAPLPSVGTEDPALSSGADKVVMWSYPIIKDGLIYVVDVRNGLYILRYHGPFEAEVAGVIFLEGNSNLGEARLWETP